MKFKDILRKGLNNGFLNNNEVEEIDFKNDKDAFDYFEAIEELEDKGIQINY
ncbi:hypothetical protein LGL08_01325 [Clostridium estertheticum]|uniref:hypothetical protein n=1 Tax=Clostridium estertheticum TaxID=238834 RepID=UPI001CF4532F|nr:hypothetical protein [Clostridium estertheticum]MCB2305858.1 hypothetical protein [Clostridium estertheticum]MCB2344173.1 hypothetical protein [Clostridium estertheticum]MCB2348213.1 hypothetical protein [Clostridium estertheticum]WAG45848.1 hypothetical protein LL127_20415 [Clostridium estertheticum]